MRLALKPRSKVTAQRQLALIAIGIDIAVVLAFMYGTHKAIEWLEYCTVAFLVELPFTLIHVVAFGTKRTQSISHSISRNI